MDGVMPQGNINRFDSPGITIIIVSSHSEEKEVVDGYGSSALRVRYGYYKTRIVCLISD